MLTCTPQLFVPSLTLAFIVSDLKLSSLGYSPYNFLVISYKFSSCVAQSDPSPSSRHCFAEFSFSNILESVYEYTSSILCASSINMANLLSANPSFFNFLCRCSCSSSVMDARLLMFLQCASVEVLMRSMIFSLLFSSTFLEYFSVSGYRLEMGTLWTSIILPILLKNSLMQFSSYSKQFFIWSTSLTVLTLLVFDLVLEALTFEFPSSRVLSFFWFLESLPGMSLDSGMEYFIHIDCLSSCSFQRIVLTIFSYFSLLSSPTTALQIRESSSSTSLRTRQY